MFDFDIWFKVYGYHVQVKPNEFIVIHISKERQFRTIFQFPKSSKDYPF